MVVRVKFTMDAGPKCCHKSELRVDLARVGNVKKKKSLKNWKEATVREPFWMVEMMKTGDGHICYQESNLKGF